MSPDVTSLHPRRVGVIGAGKVGMTVARAAVEAGYDVGLAGSGDAERLALTAQFLAPGARPMTVAEVAEHAEVVVLAVPMHRFRELDRHVLDGRIVIDPMNYWRPIDGDDPDLDAAGPHTSELVQAWFAGAHVVKSLNQLSYYDLDERRRPAGDPERVAQAVASDRPHAARVAMELLDRLGFDAVDAGPLAAGTQMAPGSEAFGAAYDATTLAALLDGTRGVLSAIR